MIGYQHLIKQIEPYILHLKEQERAELTIEKYVRDVRKFLAYLKNEGELQKQTVIHYKAQLQECHTASSVNSMLSAINGFFKFVGLESWRVKPVRIQHKIFCDKSGELNREEYQRLLNEALRRRDKRLYLLLMTLCATGIRVSELPGITVGAVKTGRSEVLCKGKCRVILLPRELCRLLRDYARESGITAGSIFVTRSGKNMDRSNIWKNMKELCAAAHVAPTKVFPHNLRHLFARTYYSREKDLTHLADLLGHSNVNTTRIYIISSGIEQRRQLEKMGLTSA